MQVHVGFLGAHHSVDQTLRVLRRIVYWPTMVEDVQEWIHSCMTCIRFRKQTRKTPAVAVKPVDAECWEEVMIDLEGQGVLFQYVTWCGQREDVFEVTQSWASVHALLAKLRSRD